MTHRELRDLALKIEEVNDELEDLLDSETMSAYAVDVIAKAIRKLHLIQLRMS